MKYSIDYQKLLCSVCKIFDSNLSYLIRWVNPDKFNNNFFNNKKVRYVWCVIK